MGELRGVGGSVHCYGSVLVVADQGENLVQEWSLEGLKTPCAAGSSCQCCCQTGHVLLCGV